MMSEDGLLPSSVSEHSEVNYQKSGSGRAGLIALGCIVICLIPVIIALAALLAVSRSDKCPDAEFAQARFHQPYCEDDWIWYKGKCYFFSEDDGSWENSQASCALAQASLAVVETQQELDFMMRYKGVDDHWIGLKRETEQPWKWPNGTAFNNWFQIKGESNCAYLNHEGVRNARCYAARKWICSTSEDYGKRMEYDLASLEKTKDV